MRIGARVPSPAGGSLPSPRPAAAVLFVLAAVLYLPTLGNGLVNFDDHRYVAGNPFASRGLSGIPAAWTSSYDDAYYPLTHTLYCVVQAIAGPSPLAHHLLTLVLFALSAALVPAALAAFRVPRSAAFWAAVIWAFHPLRVESVSWAASLKDTLSLVLVLGSVALHGAGRKPWAALVFALALLAKSMVFPVAGIFALLEWRDGRSRQVATASRGGGRVRKSPGAEVLRAAWRSLPFLVPAVAAAALGAALHLGDPDRAVPGGSLLAAIPSVLWLPWWYLGRTLVPLPSQAVYRFEPVAWLDLRLLAALVLWGLAALWVARGLRGANGEPRPASSAAAEAGTDRLLAVAAFWLPFAAVTGLVPLLNPVADRYSLLPSLAAIAVAVAAGERALPRRPRATWAVTGILAAAALVLGGLSVTRQREWKDSISLWEAELARDGDSVPAHLALAGAYALERRWGETERELAAVDRLAGGAGEGQPLAGTENLRQGKGGARLLLDVAGSALKEGRAEAADLASRLAVRIDDSAPARALAAQAARVRGRSAESLAHAERALALDPSREDAVVSRALALADLGRYDEALAVTGRPLVNPRQRALLGAVRALVLSRTGREAEARALLESLQGQLPLPPSATR